MAAKKASKNKIEAPIKEDIRETSLDELMGDRYGIYAKDVIQDRAIPDARDGMKPVQRRIIFDMWTTGNTIEKPTRKCAHIVGDVMGKYHPHGDSSIYEALVRMSQKWRVRLPLIDFQGNNGSMDGDGPAAYRYTEARLAAVSNEMVRDIEKNTVDMELTFDDVSTEPTVLPCRFPNLLVNGAEGIAVGMATEIPPHNLREISSAIVYRIGHPDCAVDALLKFVPGPDFPTGGIIYRCAGLEDIYKTGHGRIEVAGKTEIVDNPDGFKQIIITEIPYGVIKSVLVFHIDTIRHDKIINGIQEVRDETDKYGLRIAIDLKPDANPTAILSYLMKKTELAGSYTANMVAIVDGRPKTLTLLDYADTYIAHQVEVITRRCKFDLARDTSRLSIVDGLIKAISILDEVVAIIKKSADKADSKTNLEKAFGFTSDQSEAIVMMPLYKLSHTDVTVLEEEKASLEAEIAELNAILSSKEKLDGIIIADLKTLAKLYGDARRTVIAEQPDDSMRKIQTRDLIAKEDVMVTVTRDGYIKSSSMKSFVSSGGPKGALPGMKPGDTLIYSGQCETIDFMILFTNRGNYLFIPVHKLKDTKWLAEGVHVNFVVSLPPEEKIVRAFAVKTFRSDLFIALLSRFGQIKRISLADLKTVRYKRPIAAMKLLHDDEVIDACLTSGNSDLFVTSESGQATFFNENEMAPSSTHSGGFKVASFKGDNSAGILPFGPKEGGKIILVTDLGHTRVFDISHIEKTKRLARTTEIFHCFKNEPHKLIYIGKVLDKASPFSLLTTMTDGTYGHATWEDFYLTPMDKVARMDNGCSKKLKIAQVNRADSDIITDETAAFAGANPTELKPTESTEPAQEAAPKENFEQIDLLNLDDGADKK